MPVAADEAISRLSDYLNLYFEGMDKPLAYLPDTAMAGIAACLDKKGNWMDDASTLEKAFSKMYVAFNGGYMTNGEGENAYVARVWPHADDRLMENVLALGQAVLLPALLAEESPE